MKNILIANWKLYVNPRASVTLARTYRTRFSGTAFSPVSQVICPATPVLGEVGEVLNGSPILLGAQTVGLAPGGAATGDVSAALLKETGCRYVIVGHSERRAAGETDAEVAQKLVAASAAGLRPILCVGEPATVRARGRTNAFLVRQLRAALAQFRGRRLIVAYEPTWAISKAGKVPRLCPPEDAEATRRFIEQTLSTLLRGRRIAVSLLYGGSVSGKNIGAYVRTSSYRGALVGFASTKPGEYGTMLRVLCGS